MCEAQNDSDLSNATLRNNCNDAALRADSYSLITPASSVSPLQNASNTPNSA